jgi:lipopolysaccharide/colanic/teichoic acid biosynthesis glycosyltransferase
MTTAEMTQSQFLSHLPSLDTAGDGEAASDVVVESSFFRVKEVLDRIAGLVLLLPILPLIGLLVALVRLTSRGPGVFAQKRVGKKGRIFTMYKLRSMRIDAGHEPGLCGPTLLVTPALRRWAIGCGDCTWTSSHNFSTWFAARCR